MTSPRVPSRHVLPDNMEPVQERAAKDYAKRMKRLTATEAPPERLCRHCAAPLMSGAEYRLGIHVWCVYHIENRVVATRIPGPSYGKR